MNNARLRLFVGIAVETVRENAPVVRYLGPSALSGFRSGLAAIGAVPVCPALRPPRWRRRPRLPFVTPSCRWRARTDIGWARGPPCRGAGRRIARRVGPAGLRPTVLTGGRWDGVSLVPGTPTVVRADGEFSFNLQTDLSRVFGAGCSHRRWLRRARRSPARWRPRSPPQAGCPRGRAGGCELEQAGLAAWR